MGKGEKTSIWRTMRTYLPRAFPYLRPHKKLFAVTLVLSLGGVALSLAEPWPLALLVDGVLRGGQELPGFVTRLVGEDAGRLIVFAVALGFGITLVNSGFNVVNSYVQTRLEQRMVLHFRSDLFQHVHRLSFAFHDERRKGMLMFALNNQARAVGEIMMSLIPLVQAVLTLIGMFIIAYTLHPVLALLSLSVAPLVYYALGVYGNRVEPRLRHVRGLEGTSLSIVHEAMSMMRVIVSFRREHHEHGKFWRQGSEAVGARIDLTVRQTAFSLAVSLITAAGTALVLGVGAHLVLRRQLSVGQLLVVLSYVAAVYQPLEQISGTLVNLQERLIALEMATRILDTPPEVEDPEDGIVLDDCSGRMEFHDVSYSYEGRVDTLKNVSFVAEPGHVVGIVGPTGAGKSTLVSLIPRFFDPSSGHISLDGVDIRKLELEFLRNQMSVVLQDALLFSGSIEDNIRYGRLDASMDDVIDAAKAANAHDFIMKLPKRYDTVLGEGGSKLSGGERQRISIARAFLKDATIIILDEPTSSIDSRTETVILDALGKLVEGRTTFMIAHRLATVRHADQLLVLNDGQIVQQGTHDELMAQDGLYEEMYRAQTGQRQSPPDSARGTLAPVAVPARVMQQAAAGEVGDKRGKLDLNRVSRQRLAELPGVGPRLAKAIVMARRERGGFLALEDLLEVDGIEPSLLTRLSVDVTVRSATIPLDLNSASAEELTALPGLDPALADAIVRHRRATGGFSAVEDLLTVRGIDPATLETLGHRVAVRRDPAGGKRRAAPSHR